jgi:hypothetical protein
MLCPDENPGHRGKKPAINCLSYGKAYPEDKLTEDDQDYILEELGRMFHGTLNGELPHLRSFRLVRGTLMCVCLC